MVTSVRCRRWVVRCGVQGLRCAPLPCGCVPPCGVSAASTRRRPLTRQRRLQLPLLRFMASLGVEWTDGRRAGRGRHPPPLPPPIIAAVRLSSPGVVGRCSRRCRAWSDQPTESPGPHPPWLPLRPPLPLSLSAVPLTAASDWRRLRLFDASPAGPGVSKAIGSAAELRGDAAVPRSLSIYPAGCLLLGCVP